MNVLRIRLNHSVAALSADKKWVFEITASTNTETEHNGTEK